MIRVLYGKPEFTKPKLGKAPSYLEKESITPAYEMNAKFNTLKSAISNQKSNIKECRRQFFDACYQYCDSIKLRASPDDDDFPEKVLSIHRSLISARDILTDWVLLEGDSGSDDFTKAMIGLMESLLELRERPSNVNSWNDTWYLPHKIFSYETFLYILAALIKIDAFKQIHVLLYTNYLLPIHIRNTGKEFARFSEFFINSNYLQEKLAPDNFILHSPVAELVKKSASRSDISFDELKQADLVALMVSFVSEGVFWYPQLLLYSSHYESYPLFVRAIQRRGFENIATITGISDSKVLANKLNASYSKTDSWHHFSFDRNFAEKMNADRMNSID